jgi:benzoylsuccinyl-CoA thiolase BbsB subunit
MRDVAVVGGGMTVFGKFPEKTPEALGCEAMLSAMKDADVKPKDVGFASCGTVYGGWCVGQRMLKEAGLSNMEVLNVENACASGASAFREAWFRVAAGQCDIAIAGGVESMTTSPVARTLIPPPPDDVDGQLGLTVPMFFALMMRRHMHEYGTTPEQFARVSVKNHENGCLNPYSQYKKRLTIEEVLGSRMICDPITLLECCPNSDGAAAVVLCAKEIAGRFTSTPMVVAASVLGSGDFLYRWQDATFSDMSHRAATAAYEMAGIGPRDIDVVELHDAFVVAELMHYEDLALCAKGEGGRFIDSGGPWLDGTTPVNPSGGLLSKGHPLAATGVAQVVEVWRQLRGKAGENQVKGAQTALTHVMGGYVSGLETGAVSVHIFKV